MHKGTKGAQVSVQRCITALPPCMLCVVYVSMGMRILLYTCICTWLQQLSLFPDFQVFCAPIKSTSRISLATPGTDVLNISTLVGRCRYQTPLRANSTVCCRGEVSVWCQYAHSEFVVLASLIHEVLK